jgi:hypothetical protein
VWAFLTVSKALPSRMLPRLDGNGLFKVRRISMLKRFSTLGGLTSRKHGESSEITHRRTKLC